MRISSMITPFAWFDKYHDQNRFDNDCNSVCEFKLITDTARLLPFQFKRAASPYLMTDWILRKVCTDPLVKVLSKDDTNFVGGSMSWVDVNQAGEGRAAWGVNCNGGVCAITGGAEYPETTLKWTGLTIGKTYTYNFIVSKFSSSGILTLANGATILVTVSAPGVYTATFTATSTEMSFAYSLITNDGDSICIQYIQLEEAFEVGADDVVLDQYIIRYFNDGEGNDYFVYCGAEFSTLIPPGTYYSILKDEGGNLYYSEVITVEDFKPEKSPYLLFEWWNTCDLKDIIYHKVIQNGDDIGCYYRNKLWLADGVLTRPEYLFKEEGEEDGNQSFNPTFQKLDKNVTLIAAKCPEYIIDALNGVRLHDTIQFTKPLRNKQEFVDSPIPVISAEASTTYIFNDCFANVELKLLLDEKFVDETCCVDIEKPECVGCLDAGTINVYNPDVYEYAFIVSPTGSDEEGGLYKYIDGEWVLQDPSDVLICTNDGRVWQYQPTNPLSGSTYGYAATSGAGSLVYFAFVSGTTWNVRGSINSFAYGQVEFSTNGGATWLVATNKFKYTDIFVNFPVVLPGNPCCGDFLVRIRSFDLNDCDYGVSNSYTAPSPTNSCC